MQTKDYIDNVVLKDVNPMLLTRPEGRRALTRDNPLLFAYLYVPHLITDQITGSMTLSQFHIDMAEQARELARPGGKMREYRRCTIAPRNSGKTQWKFLITPLWIGAHGHKDYVFAFADKTSMAERHLLTFKQELSTNPRLRADFPEFCKPMQVGNRDLMNNRNEIQQSNGFIFMVSGADSNTLGAVLGGKRPDVLLFDDIERGEANYSTAATKKRLETLISDLFPMNEYARVEIVGTTTMPNSIIDQIRKAGEYLSAGHDPDKIDPDLRWVIEQNITANYYPALIETDEGIVSFWEEKFPIAEIYPRRHTRDFQKNYMNRPVSTDSPYWTEDMITVDQAESYERTIVSVDPAVKNNKGSDYTGISVISKASDGKRYVRYAEAHKINPGPDLRDLVESLVKDYDAKVVIVENNQGGDLWKQIFDGISAKLRLFRYNSGNSKEARASQGFDLYAKDEVRHTKHFPTLEEQMYVFPKGKHDDLLDSVMSGLLYFSKAGKKPVITQYNYLRGDNARS